MIQSQNVIILNFLSYLSEAWVKKLYIIYLLAVWPDLAKFRHFGTFLKVLGKFLRVYLVFGEILVQKWQIFLLLGKFSML